MKRKRTLASAVLLVCLAVSHVFAADAEVPEDLKKMQGVWITDVFGGHRTVFTIDGDQLTVQGAQRKYEIELAIQPDQKPHKRVDLKIKNATPDAKGKTCPAIYRFEKDGSLRLCFGIEDLPNDFRQEGFAQWDVPLSRDPDLRKLQGTWTARSYAGGYVNYSFDGASISVKAPSRSYEMTVFVDSGTKPHKQLDFRIHEGPADSKGKKSFGIYRLVDEDTLVLCFSAEKRPEKFEAKGFSQPLVNLERKK